ncbi:hypothetical protein FRC07_013984 [Ceratobasidium sp. 392]|nr:hypothetical protein FRC07_013984 [Ceratobasidium sp. 392]
MISFKYSVLLLAALLASVHAIPTNISTFDKRAAPAPIANGTTTVTGTLPDWGFKYRASGILIKDCNGPRSIKPCYQQRLSDKHENIDKELSFDGPYQSNWLNSKSYKADGSVTKFSFRFNLNQPLKAVESTGTTPLFFYVSNEAIDDDGSTVNMSLLVRNGTVLLNELRQIKATIPLSNFTGTTLIHTWTIKGGPGGYANVDIKNLAGKSVLKYNSGTKQHSKGSYYLQIGTGRDINPGLEPYVAYFGSYSANAV